MDQESAKPPKVEKPPKPPKPYYVKPDDLRQELVRYNETTIISNELGEMFIKIAKKFASRPNFHDYPFKDDFVNDAIYRMVEQVHKIDLNHPKCNPFTYLTKICERCFQAKIMKEKKLYKTKIAYTEKVLEDLRLEENIQIKPMYPTKNEPS